ncbi:MAG: hypothetical protein IPK12_23405 [Gemmatimonadetes bacterium]|nr:hypothetical protein [Gemmatimonadota bacterium]
MRLRLERAYDVAYMDFELSWYDAEPVGEHVLVKMPDGRDVLGPRGDFHVIVGQELLEPPSTPQPGE